MPRFRRSSAKRPINSIKHIIDSEGVLVEAGTQSEVPFVVAVPNVDTATFKPGDVRVGAKVNGFFLSVFIIGSTGAQIGGSINWYIIKAHPQQTTFPSPDNAGSFALRNQIIHMEKGLAGSGDGTAMAFKGVVAVPKGMRTMRQGEQWFFVANVNSSASSDAKFCFRAIYKSYF